MSCTQQCQNRPYVTDIAQKFKVSRSAVSKIIRNQETILSNAEVNNHQNRKRGSKHSEIDKALYLWFSEICQKDIPVSGYNYIFKAKAEKLAKDLGIEDFKASEGWLWRSKSHYQIHGEKKDADPEATDRE